MKIRKYIAVILTAAMAFTLAGCSNGSKKYEKAFEELGYEKMEEYDADDMEDDIDDGLYYSTKDEKEVKKICKITPMEKVKAKNVSSIFIGGISDDDGYFYVYSVTFKNKEDAQKCFDKNVKTLEDTADTYKSYYSKDEYDTDDGDDFYTLARLGKYTNVIMDDSKTVTYIVGYFYDEEDTYDDFESFYEAIERDCPSDLIPVKSKK